MLLSGFGNGSGRANTALIEVLVTFNYKQCFPKLPKLTVETRWCYWPLRDKEKNGC